MQRAIFLDRDGTINIEKEYLYKIEDFEYIDGAIEGLRILRNAGFILIIITNQSGIGRGYYSEKSFNVLNQWMNKDLSLRGIKIEKVYYCPHLPDAKIEKYRVDCECRKPKLGMFEQAIKEFEVDLSNSWAIGDKIRDCTICSSTDCRGFIVAKNEESNIIADIKSRRYRNIRYAENLLESAKYIVSMLKE